MRISDDWRLSPGVYDVILTRAEVMCPGGAAFAFVVCWGPSEGRFVFGNATTDELAEALEADADDYLDDHVGYGYEIEVGEDGLTFYVRHIRSDDNQPVPSAPLSAEDEAFLRQLACLDTEVKPSATVSAPWQEVGF